MMRHAPSLGFSTIDRHNSRVNRRAPAMPTRLLLALILAAACSLAGAEPGEFTNPYDIEVVIFERGASTDERWPEVSEPPPTELAVGDLTAPGMEGDKAVIQPTETQLFGPTAYSLRQKGAIVHFHQRWRQDLDEQGQGAWYKVGDENLDGVLRINLGRFLHVETDLLLRRNEQPDIRVKLRRRMRSGELHYVDHPLVGLLIQADRVETVEPDVQPEAAEPTPETVPEESVEPQQPRQPQGDLPRAMPDPT